MIRTSPTLMFQQQYDEKGGFYKSAPPGDHGAPQPSALNPNPNPNLTASPRVSCLISPEPSDDELRLLQQMGVHTAFAWIGREQCTAAFLQQLVLRAATFDIAVNNVGCRELGKSPHIILGTEHRERDIAEFVVFLHALHSAEIRVTTFTWEADGVWNTDTSLTRGGAEARAVHTDRLAQIPLSRDREHSEEELWDSLEFFLARVLPVAEELGIVLALHPNDPPVPQVGGIPCLIRSKAAYERVFRIAKDSKALGMEFCCGCWLEGGPNFGPIYEALPEFAARGKVVHGVQQKQKQQRVVQLNLLVFLRIRNRSKSFISGT